MDTVNELGKELKKTRNSGERALQKQRLEYGIGERTRDIFDEIIPFIMYFTTVRQGMSIVANLKFELPPPNMGMGNCCGDCFCAICEKFGYTDVTSQQIFTTYPYLAGTTRVSDSDGGGSPWLAVETDPDAGIIDLNYDPIELDSYVITVCYVYKYEQNCTTNAASMIANSLATIKGIGSSLAQSNAQII